MNLAHTMPPNVRRALRLLRAWDGQGLWIISASTFQVFLSACELRPHSPSLMTHRGNTQVSRLSTVQAIGHCPESLVLASLDWWVFLSLSPSSHRTHGLASPPLWKSMHTLVPVSSLFYVGTLLALHSRASEAFTPQHGHPGSFPPKHIPVSWKALVVTDWFFK